MKLSITIATYNVQNFICESIASILNQTFQDFELICIDDGSTDNTVSILKEFASRDQRIKIIEKKINEGLAVARNLSLELAKGKYVTFLDGDDFYDLTLFEKAVSLADKTNSDLVLWDYVSFRNPKEIDKLKAVPSDLLNFDASNKIALLQRPSFTSVKLLRTEKVKSLGIHFPNGFTRQDIPVHWHLITKLSKIEILAEKLTYYRQQIDATTAKKDRKLFHLVFVMDIIEKYLKDEVLFDTYKNQFYIQQLNFFHGMYDNIQEQFKAEALELINQRLSGEHIQFLKATKSIRPQARWFLLSLKGDSLSYSKLRIWSLTRKIYRLVKSNVK